MARDFNVTGNCFAEDHYMADVSKKLEQTLNMIEKGRYFIINRPRQYGKTTTMYSLVDILRKSGKYLVFNISFEGIGDSVFEDEAKFCPAFIRLLANRLWKDDPKKELELLENSNKVISMNQLATFIKDFSRREDKKIVVFIDEVDKSSNNQLFISFLAMLRNLYLDRKNNPTFHSVVLAGVHDVKTLKLKLRPDDEQKYNSPWNIAETFKVDMNFYPNEIKPMLDDYAAERGITMDTAQIAERLFYFTSGYPYLVSQLCKIIDEDILPTKTEKEQKEWTIDDVNKSFQLILRERNNANFDTVMKNLEQYPDLYEVVFSIVINGYVMPFNQYEPVINLGVHGIFAASEKDTLIIHNRIYRELIANMMVAKWRTTSLINGNTNADSFNLVNQYLLPNNGLLMEKVLENFQAFMKKEYSGKDRKFLERDGRLIFLAFIKPIINGGGYDFKEPQISEEKRLDVVITYYQHQYVAELKIWYGTAAHDKGVLQLADYLDRLGLSVGYLVIFDHSKRKTWKKEWVDVAGKRIFCVKV
jgi:AAA-like domain